MPSDLYWAPPRSNGSVWLTRTWRIVAHHPHDAAPALYIALSPDSLYRGYEIAFAALEEWQVNHRHARDAAVLQAYCHHPQWAGKAVIISEPRGRTLTELIHLLDSALANQGLTGPAALTGAKPFGGQSGLLYLGHGFDAAPETPAQSDRRQRLSQLLNT